MRARSEDRIFVCQALPGLLKAVVCRTKGKSGIFVENFFLEPLPAGAEGTIGARIRHAMKTLDARTAPVILALSVSNVTCRFLKVPTRDRAEIQRIVELQAASFLPYAQSELVTAHEAISSDANGYTSVNLIMAPKETIARQLGHLKEAGVSCRWIILSSYGLLSYFKDHAADASGTVMLVEIDKDQTEIAIVKDSRLLLSRYFRTPDTGLGCEGLFLDEILKTQKAYFKEVSDEDIGKIYVYCPPPLEACVRGLLAAQTQIPCEVAPGPERLCPDPEVAKRLASCGVSFVNLIGLGLRRSLEHDLTLLPAEEKRMRRLAGERRRIVFNALSVLSIFAIFALAVFQGLRNKATYRTMLAGKVKQMEAQAGFLDRKDRYLRSLEERQEHEEPFLSVYMELHRLLPKGIELESISYEARQSVVLRGSAPALGQVWEFATLLEHSAVLGAYGVEVRRTSRSDDPQGGQIWFEIGLLRKTKNA